MILRQRASLRLRDSRHPTGMELDNTRLLLSQIGLSIVAWTTVAVVFVRPRLAPLDPRTALRWLLAPHMFRHVGMSLLATGVPGPGLDPSFASWVATGDLVTMLLATAAVIALGRPGRLGLSLAALATTVGLADLLHNLRNGLRIEAANDLQGGWIVVAIVVPLMLIAHVAALRMLVRRETWASQGARR